MPTTKVEQLLRRIRLELARDHEFPAGSSDRGYDFIAPLDDNGHLVAGAWKALREPWRSSNRFANCHRTAEIGICVEEGRLRAGSDGIEETADEASKRGTKRNIAYLHVGEADRPQPLDKLGRYLGCVLADRLCIRKHFDVPLAQTG